MRIRLFIPLMLCLLFTSTLKSKAQNSPTFENCFYAILSLDVQKADSLLNSISPIEKAYLTHYQLFINVMLHDSIHSKYSTSFKQITNLLTKNENESYALAFLSEVYLQKGIIDYKFEKGSAAVFSFFKAYRYWQKSEEEYPNYLGNLKLKGVFNLLMSNMPQPYKKWAGWIGFKGDNKIGFSNLNNYLIGTSEKKASEQEAILYLGFSYLKFSEDFEKAEDFIKKNSDKTLLPITQFTMGRCAFKIRKPQLAKQWLNNLKNHSYLPFFYQKGKFAVFYQDKEAEKYLKEYISRKKTGQFVADAHRHLSWYYLLQGDTSAYKKQRSLTKQLNNYPTWEDQQANYEASLSITPNVSLLSARILFDAGNYQSALDSLQNIQVQKLQTQSNQVEFQYRVGRCYHMLKQQDKAIFHYTEAIKLGENNTRYFAPFAAIFNAELLLNGNPDKAYFFLQEAKRLNNGEYKNTIQQKIEHLSEKLKPTS